MYVLEFQNYVVEISDVFLDVDDGGLNGVVTTIIIIACVGGVCFIFSMASIYCILRLIEEDSNDRGMHLSTLHIYVHKYIHTLRM